MSASSLRVYGRTCRTVLEESAKQLFDIPSVRWGHGRTDVRSKLCVWLCWVVHSARRMAQSSFGSLAQSKPRKVIGCPDGISCVSGADVLNVFKFVV